MSTSIPAQHHNASPYPPDSSDGDAEPWDGQPVAFARVPPQDLDAEQSVIGSLLLAGTPGSASYRYFGEITETGIRAEEHYRPAHQMIHRAICALHAAGEPVDPVTVAAALTKRGEISKVGGPSYLHACVQAVPTAANGAQYAEIVRAKAYRRAVIESAQRILQYAYSEEGDESEVRELVEQ